MLDLAKVSTGKKPFVPKRADMHLRTYFDREAAAIDLADAPAQINWFEAPTPTGGLPEWNDDVLGNDKCGDCVYAAIAKMLMLQSQLAGFPIHITTDQVLNEYHIGTGFDPATGYNDNGAVLREVCDHGRNFGLFGSKFAAYLFVNPLDKLEWQWAMNRGGGLLLGFSLPKKWSSMTDDQGNPDWTVPADGWKAGEGPGEGGGHAVFSHATNGCVTWGLSGNFSDQFVGTCCDEAVMLITPEWEQRNGSTPCGLAYSDVLADARARGAR